MDDDKVVKIDEEAIEINTDTLKHKELKKPKTTILKDAFILFVITLVSGAILSYVYEVTKEPIAKKQEENKMNSYQVVFDGADKFEADESLKKVLNKNSSFIKDNNYDGITIDEVMYAMTDNEVQGYVMSITSANGYGGNITISLGVSNDGTVNGMEILSINETAGLGMKATEDSFKNQFKGKNVEQFEYTKNGSKEDNEIDALSGATITTKAVTGAVNAGVAFVNDVLAKSR